MKVFARFLMHRCIIFHLFLRIERKDRVLWLWKCLLFVRLLMRGCICFLLLFFLVFDNWKWKCRSANVFVFIADGDDAQRIFLLYIDRSAKIVSAFSRNSHPNTITQLQETNPWIGTRTSLKIKFFFFKFLYICICTCQNDLISVRLLMAASFVIYKQPPFPANNSFISTRCIKTLSTDATLPSW